MNKEGRAAFVLPGSRFAKRGAMTYNKNCIERAAMKKGGGEMNQKLYDAALCGGYAVFMAVTILSFRWLTDGMNMDGLLAFLLAQSVGILLLYHLRRIACYLEARTFSTHEYGAFLLINAMVLVVNALVMYTMDTTSGLSEGSLCVYATIVCACANAVLQAVQTKQVADQPERDE